jgi:hypothetical protein
MSVSGTLLVILGPAIAKTILGSWLNNSPLANAISSEIVDKITDTIANPSDRQNKRLQQNLTGFGQQRNPDFREYLADIAEPIE